MPLKLSNINFEHLIILSTTPVIAVWGILNVKLKLEVFILAFILYCIAGLGITVGYHRYWSHRTYEATKIWQLFFMLAGTMGLQGSIKWWSRDHRAHHRYTDTNRDPYSAHKGLLWSHIGWMLFKKDKSDSGKVDISDLNKDPIVNFQDRFYFILGPFMAFVFPSLLCGLLFNDYFGGLIYAGVVRQVFLHHATFCINSLAHWVGDQPFDDYRTPRDNWITAIITFGEGYHNFHHEFPSDYRNAIKFWQFDPSKWTIYLGAQLGLTYHLNQFSSNEIKKGRLQMQQKKIDKASKKLDWGVPMESLPEITWEEYRKLVKQDKKKLLVIEGLVYNVEKFMDEHPGGKGFLSSSLGRDVTTSFNGGVYNHANAARNLMTQMRYAKLKIDSSIPSSEIATVE